MRNIRVRPAGTIGLFTRRGEMGAIISLLLSLLLLAGAGLLWIISLPKIDPGKMNDLGLVSVLPVTFFVALVVLTISFMISLHQDASNPYILLLHLVLLIFILHATPQIVYGTLRYSWAWKHVGIVDYIQRHGTVDPQINNLNAYHNWPGFFALAAFINQISGLSSSLSYAGWGPVFFNLLDLGALLMIFKSLTIDQRHIWLSAWLFFLFSWVGQDYFSPQAFTYFLYLVTFAVLLRWFRLSKNNLQAQPKVTLHPRWLSKIYNTVVRNSTQDNDQIVWTNARQRIFLMASLVVIFFVIASSHQLTPLMIISGLVLLAFFQVINQRFLPLLMASATVIWIIFMAVGFLDGNLSWVVRSFGSFFQNINGNLLNLSVASKGQQFIAKVDRVLSLSVWVLGFLGLIRRYRKGHWDLITVLMAAAPIPMLLMNAYGGEMLFRVYLFGLPFITFLAAGLFYPSLQSGSSYKTPAYATFLSLLLIPGFLFGYYGKESMYYFSPNEVAAAKYVFSVAPRGSVIIDGTWDWPRQYVNYEYYNYLSVAGYTENEVQKIIKDPVDEFAKLMDDASSTSVYANPSPVSKSMEGPGIAEPRDADDYPAAFIVITRSQIAEAQMTGILPVDWLSNLGTTLTQSSNFKIIFSNSDAIVIEFVHTNEPGK